jgi:hypothetical protein
METLPADELQLLGLLTGTDNNSDHGSQNMPSKRLSTNTSKNSEGNAQTAGDSSIRDEESRAKAGAMSSGSGKPRQTISKDADPQRQADWRNRVLAEVRRIICAADPQIKEEVKWVKPTNPAGVAVWSHAGIVCTGETYQQVVKLTFARGASLPDPHHLFNASLEGKDRRAIDIRNGDVIDEPALSELIRAAVASNLRSKTAY